MSDTIRMVDLRGQYDKIKTDIDNAIHDVLDNTTFIGGEHVKHFESQLSEYLSCPHTISCANGTDALQIALMALQLHPGDEVIVPSFTYVASAEVIALLGLTPVMVDVDPATFNTTAELIAPAITPRTRAIIPVHLFGQSCDMEPILDLARAHHLYIVEDNAQAMGADYLFSDGHRAMTGTMGDIGCTSFFPSKNLGCYGDGGALFAADPDLATRIRMIANHGQAEKYHHSIVGCNSRLDALQAAILEVKLRHIKSYIAARREAACRYNRLLASTPLILPIEHPRSSHVYHQYTVQVPDGQRDALRQYLADHQIPSMVYYPLPLHHQKAFLSVGRAATPLPVTEQLCTRVLSLPMHTELTSDQQQRIAETIIDFYSKNGHKQ